MGPQKMRLHHIMVIPILMTIILDTEVHGLFFNRLYEAKKNFFFPSTSARDLNCSHKKESCQMVTKCQPRSGLKCHKYDDGTLQQSADWKQTLNAFKCPSVALFEC